jgi:hypothetical protein
VIPALELPSSGEIARPSGLKARAALAQPNGLGYDRSIPPSEPHRGAMTNVATMPDAAYGSTPLLLSNMQGPFAQRTSWNRSTSQNRIGASL